jgi:hypothetical protein
MSTTKTVRFVRRSPFDSAARMSAASRTTSTWPVVSTSIRGPTPSGATSVPHSSASVRSRSRCRSSRTRSRYRSRTRSSGSRHRTSTNGPGSWRTKGNEYGYHVLSRTAPRAPLRHPQDREDRRPSQLARALCCRRRPQGVQQRLLGGVLRQVGEAQRWCQGTRQRGLARTWPAADEHEATHVSHHASVRHRRHPQ